MKKYFNEAQQQLKTKYKIDLMEDILLGIKDTILLYADIKDKKSITLNVINNNLELINLPDQSSIRLDEIISLIDFNNGYAEVSGHESYHNYVTSELYNFDLTMNITFPIKTSKRRTWVHFGGFKVEKNPDIYVLFITNLTELMEKEEEIYIKTHKDSLTSLFNKYAFDFHYGKRYKNKDIHILYFDLDDFKEINDQNSHIEGNRVLVEFANILKTYDTEFNRFYRLGGDEFVGMIFEDNEKVLKMADDILEKTRKIKVPNQSKPISVSAGIIKGTIRDDLVRKADDLLYQAKKNGKNQYIFEIEKS